MSSPQSLAGDLGHYGESVEESRRVICVIMVIALRVSARACVFLRACVRASVRQVHAPVFVQTRVCSLVVALSDT